MKRGARLLWVAPPALVVAGPLPASAAVYLSVEEAREAIFAGLAMEAAVVELTPPERGEIERRSGQRVRRARVDLWRGPGGERLFVDRVLGKHEEITYALGIDSSGAVSGVEILEYRETYGGEIRRESWRKQFVGRRAGDRLRLGEDVENISGATLSCRHVTDGIRRLLATREVLAERGTR